MTSSGSGPSATSIIPETTLTTRWTSTKTGDTSLTASPSVLDSTTITEKPQVTTSNGSNEDTSMTSSGSGPSATSIIPETTVTTRWTSTKTGDTSLTASPSVLDSTTITEETSTNPPLIPPKEPRMGVSLSFHITNLDFTEELQNSSSEEFKNLSMTIGEVYQAIYNCSDCPDREVFLGYKVISFSNGSVAVDSELHFRATKNTTNPEFATKVGTSLTNASDEIRKNLEVSNVTSTPVVVPTTESPTTTKDTSPTHSPSSLTPTPTPSERSPTTTSSLPTTGLSTTIDTSLTGSPTGPDNTKTTEEPSKGTPPTPTKAPVGVYLSFHITNWNFTEELRNESSEEFKNLSTTVGEVYQAVYNSSSFEDNYLGYSIKSFSPGSVKVDSEVHFRRTDNTSSNDFASQVETGLKDAPRESLQDMKLENIQAVIPTELPTTTVPTTEPTSRTEDTSPTTSQSSLTMSLKPTDTMTTAQPSVSPEDHTRTKSPSGDTSPTSGPEETTKAPVTNPATAVQVSLTFHIRNMNFSEQLKDRNSQEFKNLSSSIGKMYQAVYNSSSFADDYRGFSIKSFSSGSVKVDSEVRFRKTDNTSSPEFANQVETSLKDAPKDSHQGMDLADIQAVIPTELPTTTVSKTEQAPGTKETSPTTPPKPSEDTATPVQPPVSPEDHTTTESPGPSEDTSSTAPTKPSSPEETSKPLTAAPATVRVSVTFHITNMPFSEELSNPNSKDYTDLKEKIDKMYKAVYVSSAFADSKEYLGFSIISFSSGSVMVNSEVRFRKTDSTSSPEFANRVETSLKNAPKDSYQGMELTDIQAKAITPTSAPDTTKTDGSGSGSDSGGVPGWGIALLVLVSIILFLLLLYCLYLIVRWCRRQHRGSMDLISTRDSYHPMNEYPTYETHGRYAAPGSKENPYNATLPRNGTSGFSYTNPVMANNNL
ncbi:mucin-1 [Anolis sagrei]|uniref:mucin-1 n=1 Tax=Anolis sagrei TaxID=38937 RepID=UPI0035214EC9